MPTVVLLPDCLAAFKRIRGPRTAAPHAARRRGPCPVWRLQTAPDPGPRLGPWLYPLRLLATLQLEEALSDCGAHLWVRGQWPQHGRAYRDPLGAYEDVQLRPLVELTEELRQQLEVAPRLPDRPERCPQVA